jgi:hypothetical protein
MNILGVQIIGILFAMFMIYVSFLNWKKSDISRSEMSFWLLLWIIFILITLFPKILQGLSTFLVFTRVMDLLMVIAFMILTIIGYMNHISNRELEKKIERLVKNQAIKKYLTKKNKK